jgi:predicted heme/steroid binding protein
MFRKGKFISGLVPFLVASSLPLLLLALMPIPSVAMPEFAAETGLACSDCHENGADGGPLTQTGADYLSGDLDLDGEAPRASTASILSRGLVRYVHLVVGVVWFGAIAYIHLFTKPRKLIKGLPRAEMRLGWFSIIVMAVTGSLLTSWRVDSVSELATTAFGRVWFVKVSAFLLMVLIAAATTTVLNRRMRRAAEEEGGPGACGLVRFVYAGRLYDATDSKWWQNGVHAGRHRAGTDLTAAVADAPHGPEVLERLKLVGPVAEGAAGRAMPKAARVFVVLAYVNLALMAVVLFCVSFWGWGLTLLR